MSAAPRVTVVTTTYNYPDALQLAMETAFEQSFEDFEYLVIGDGCTDETEAVVAGFSDPRIRWKNLPENLGNQADVNRIALEMARGELIAYLNHDDLWFPDHLQSLVTAVDDGGFDLVASLCLSICPPPDQFREVIGLPFVPKDRSRFGVTSMTTNCLHSAELARRAGGWKSWRELEEFPTLEFFKRLRLQGNNHAVVPRVTSLKFHSAARKNSYSKKDASEQRLWLEKMRGDPDLRHREVTAAFALHTAKVQYQQFNYPPKPENAPKGWKIEQLRRARGLQPNSEFGEIDPDQRLGMASDCQQDPIMHVGHSGEIWLSPRDVSDTVLAGRPKGRPRRKTRLKRWRKKLFGR